MCLLKTLDPNYSCNSADGLHPIHPPISRTGVAPNLKETGGWPRGAQSGAGSGRRPPSIRSNVSSEAVVPAWLARCSEQRNNRVEAQQVAGFAILYLYAIIICRHYSNIHIYTLTYYYILYIYMKRGYFTTTLFSG